MVAEMITESQPLHARSTATAGGRDWSDMLRALGVDLARGPAFRQDAGKVEARLVLDVVGVG
jgi:hypothetical protein